MRQRKTDVVNWNDYVAWGTTTSGSYNNSQVQLVLSYNNSPATGNTLSQLFYNSPTNVTYAQLSDAFMDYWKDNSGAGAQPKEWISLEMYQTVRNDIDNAVANIVLATIQLKKVKFNISFKSVLNVQNRTLAEASYNDEPAYNRDETTNIDNVPLSGKVYRMAKKWGNYIDVQLRPGSIQGAVDMDFAKRLTADSETGIVQFESSTNDPAHLKKPPKCYFLGFKNDVNVILQPSTIKSDVLKFRTTISLDKLLIKFASVLGNSSVNLNQSCRVEFGHMSLLGLEKLLDANRNTGSPINLGYQLTQTYSCSLTYAKSTPSATIINNTSTPISYSTDRPSV